MSVKQTALASPQSFGD